MSPDGWYITALLSLYAAIMLAAVTANGICSWRAHSLSNLTVILQVTTSLIGLLVGMLYGSAGLDRLVDHLIGIPGIHVPARETLFVIGAVCAQSITAIWSHRRFPAGYIYSSCGVGALLLTALVVTALRTHQRGEPFGLQQAHSRADVAAYYAAFYAYVIWTGGRLAYLGRLGASRLNRRPEQATADEMLAARGMWSIAAGSYLVLGFAVTHLIVVTGTYAGMHYRWDPLLDIGVACYLLANFAYVVGVCYPTPAMAWARRKGYCGTVDDQR
jgi:hypothetical protein